MSSAVSRADAPPGAAPSLGRRVVGFAHHGASIELELPPSAEALIDDEAFAADERLPYWADLWPSATALARHLIETPSVEPRAIELGCGVGLVSLALAWRGVEVLATDYEPLALEHLRASAARSGIPAPAVAVVDWRSPPPLVAAPLVVAADVLYEQRNVEALARCLPQMVARGGRALIADPGRRWLELFLARMQAQGWSARSIAEREEQGTAPGASPSRVRLLELAPAGWRGGEPAAAEGSAPPAACAARGGPLPSAVRPPVIGLVGGIGAGKSTVASMLHDLGCEVCDSDALAREALLDPAVVAELRARWGDRVLDPAGIVDRRAVSEIIFADATERRWLESVTHPWIEARRRQRFAQAGEHVRALVIDAPLLLESGLDRQCDAILFVDAPRQLRLARVRQTRGWDEQELARREAAQWPLERKRARATATIVNGGDLHAVREQALRALAGIAPAADRSAPSSEG